MSSLRDYPLSPPFVFHGFTPMATTCRHFVLAKLRLTTSLACLQHSTNAIHVVFAISSGGLPGVGRQLPEDDTTTLGCP